jgi:hypothetical protein
LRRYHPNGMKPWLDGIPPKSRQDGGANPAADLGLELGIHACEAYILEAARSSAFPLLELDGPIRRNATKPGLSLVELDR